MILEVRDEWGEAGLISIERIERAILLIRGEKVMLDRELAELYGVETRALNQPPVETRRREIGFHVKPAGGGKAKAKKR